VHTSWKKSSILSIAPAATSHTTQQASTDRVLKGKSIPPTHTKHKLRHTAIGDRGRFGAFAPPPPPLPSQFTDGSYTKSTDAQGADPRVWGVDPNRRRPVPQNKPQDTDVFPHPRRSARRERRVNTPHKLQIKT